MTLTPSTPSSPTPPPAPTGLLPSVAGTPQQQTLNDVTALGVASINAARSLYAKGYALVWKNPYGLTPQQVCDALGTNAAGYFASAAIVQSWANGIRSDAVTTTAFPTPKSITPQPNGTVVIGS